MCLTGAVWLGSLMAFNGRLTREFFVLSEVHKSESVCFGRAGTVMSLSILVCNLLKNKLGLKGISKE